MGIEPDFQNPWAPGGHMHAQTPWGREAVLHGWGHGNDYFTPKTKDDIRKEALLQLAVLAVVVAAPALAGTLSGGGSAGAVAMGSSPASAGGAAVQGAGVSPLVGAASGGATAGSGIGAGVLGKGLTAMALYPFLQNGAATKIASKIGQGAQALENHFAQTAPGFMPLSNAATGFEWQVQPQHPSTQLIEQVASRLKGDKRLQIETLRLKSGGSSQQVEAMVGDVLASNPIQIPSQVLNAPTSMESGNIVQESWWKGKSFGHGFIAGLVNGIGGIGTSFWEMMQLNYLTVYPYYDLIFEGGDTHRAAWEKAQLIAALTTDSVLREKAAQHIGEMWAEFTGNLAFENSSAEAGYQYGSLVPDVLLVLLSDGGWTASRILSALRNGGTELRSLFGSVFARESVGYMPQVTDILEVLNYVKKLPPKIANELTVRFASKKFTRVVIDNVMQASFEESFNMIGKTYRISIWMAHVYKDFRGNRVFSNWLDDLIRKGKLLGAETIEFEMLNVSHYGIFESFQKWAMKGWNVEIISVEGGNPMVKLTKKINDQ